MFTIIKRRELNPTVTELWIHAPLIAKKAKAGQFIIVRAKEDSERIPLTIAGFDREAGTVSIIFQVVGAGTMQLNSLKEGEAVHDFVGPLGKATEIEGLKNVCVVGGGVGCAIALPVAQALHEQGTKVTGIVGFRNKDLVILEDEFRACCDEFIIVRAKEDSERIPLTIAGFDREAGTVSIIFQIVGAGTMQLNALKEGEAVHDFVGPLGKATEIEGLKNVCVVGGGVGCAIALPIAQALHEQGTKVTGIVGFRNKDLVILEDEFRACCDDFIIMTDDGSYGEKGVVTAPLEQRIVDGANFDEVITIGPLIMMKFVVKTTKPHNVKTVVSMNPIMVDGTGMCGGCRLTVGGQTKFACVDGPDFDGFEVDFDEAMHRGTMYKPFEAHAREAECNLLKQEVQ